MEKKPSSLKQTMQVLDLKPIQDRIATALNEIDDAMDNLRRTIGGPGTGGEIRHISNLFEEIKGYAEDAQEELANFGQDYQEAIAPSQVPPEAPQYLQDMTVSQLREQLKAMGIQGYSGRTKAELIAMLARAR